MEQPSPSIEETKKPPNRYCVVPKCKNTLRNAPDKVFFFVPRGADIRRKWCEMMKRDMVSPSTCLYCCEDHFDLEEDTDNHVEYTIMNMQGNHKNMLRLKKGVLPHKFHCQNDTESPPMRNGFLKRKHSETIEGDLSPPPAEETFCFSDSSAENSLDGFTSSSSFPVYMEDTENKDDCEAGCSTSLSNTYNENEMHVDKAIQMKRKIHNKNKNGNLSANTKMKRAAVSPFPIAFPFEEVEEASMSSALPSLVWTSASEPDTSSNKSTWIIEIF